MEYDTNSHWNAVNYQTHNLMSQLFTGFNINSEQLEQQSSTPYLSHKYGRLNSRDQPENIWLLKRMHLHR